MRWILTPQDNFINLDCLCHIWPEKDIAGNFFLMGEFSGTGEEIVLTESFFHYCACVQKARYLLNCEGD